MQRRGRGRTDRACPDGAKRRPGRLASFRRMC